MTPIAHPVSHEEKVMFDMYERLLQSKQYSGGTLDSKMALFTALKQSKFDTFRGFVENGADLSFMQDGYSPLACVEDPDLFMWLLEKRAPYRSPECKEFLPYPNCALFHIQQRINQTWLPYLLRLIRDMHPLDILYLRAEELHWLIAYAKENREMAEILEKVVVTITTNNYEKKLFSRLPKFITTYGPKKFAQGLIYGRLQQLLSTQFLDQLFSKSSFVCCYLKEQAWLNVLMHNLSDLQVHQMQQQVGSAPAAIFCLGLQQANREEAVSILSLIRYIESSIEAIPQKIKQTCVQHVSAQFIAQPHSPGLWSLLANTFIDEKDLVLLTQFGFDPNQNNLNTPTILFTPLAPLCSATFIRDTKVDLHKTNNEGKDALEFFVTCEPKSMQVSLFMWRYKEDPPFNIILHLYQLGLGKTDLTAGPHPLLAVLSLVNQSSKPLPLFTFLKEIHEREGNHTIDDIIKEIPSAPAASLVLSYLMRTPDLNYKSIKLLSGLSRKDVLALHDYLFLHPQTMNRMLEIFFVIMVVRHTENARSEVSHSVFVVQMMRSIGTLRHMKDSLWECPRWQQTLIKSYYKNFIPKKAAALDVQAHSELSLLGRTVIGFPAKDDLNCVGYKFRKVGEHSKKFFQEFFVMQAFSKQQKHFESQFQKPIRTYHHIQELPKDTQASFIDRLQTPHDVFTYEASKETFTYLQHAPTIEAFREGQRRCLIDVVTMIEAGIYPEPTLWHNASNGRLYVLLIDLVRPFSAFDSSGGAGRMDQPFHKMQYSDNRLSGRVDLGDAWLRFGPEGINSVYTGPNSQFDKKCQRSKEMCGNEQNTFLDQMIGLSSQWIEQHLLLIEFLRTNGGLNWKDPVFLEKLAGYLKEDFCWIFSTRSGKSFAETSARVNEWKIDWIQMARQNAFLCNNTSEGYIPWFDEGKVPDNLYPKETKVFVLANETVQYSSKRGQHTGNHQNLGFYGGPLGMEEFVKASMLLYMSIILKEGQHEQNIM